MTNPTKLTRSAYETAITDASKADRIERAEKEVARASKNLAEVTELRQAARALHVQYYESHGSEHVSNLVSELDYVFSQATRSKQNADMELAHANGTKVEDPSDV